MPDPSTSPDAIVHVFLPILLVIEALLRQAGVPEGVVAVTKQVANLGLNAGMVAVLLRVRRLAKTPAVAGALAAGAAAMAWWIARHPGTGFEFALARSDHLLCAGLAGAAYRHLPVAARKGVLIAASMGALTLLAGPGPLVIVFAGMAAAVAAERLAAPATARGTTLVQGAILLATLAASRVAWAEDLRLGLGAQGLFAVMLLRHVSWLVDVRRGAPGTVADYWCFQLFYPCCYGATERYGDFRARNPEPGSIVDESALFRAFVRGVVYLTLSIHLHVGLDDLLAAPTWPALAGRYLLLFVDGALVGMGLWSTLQALALCWGMQIHPNFAGILAARSPSQFWHAWRGTMTRWLIDYVYIPLGGNRAHPVRNVFAVFAVSATWHWMGVPFLVNQSRPIDYLPVAAWAFVNACVLAGTGAWRRRGWALWPAGTPAPLRNGAARLGTWAFGAVTVVFLGFQGPLAPRFPEFLARLAGWH